MKSTPLTIYQGDDYTALINITTQGSPVTIDGYTAKAQLRRQPANFDATIDATFTCAVSGTTVTISLPHTATASLTGAYYWDLQLTDPTGHIRTVAHGPVNVTTEITTP